MKRTRSATSAKATFFESGGRVAFSTARMQDSFNFAFGDTFFGTGPPMIRLSRATVTSGMNDASFIGIPDGSVHSRYTAR